MVTIHDVEKRLKAINEIKNDDEAAHAMEDNLWCDVLEAIASGAANPQKLAKAVLRSRECGFARWCA